MIILGNRYEFTTYEQEQINNIFPDKKIINRDKKTDIQIIDEFNQAISEKQPTLIVLNLLQKPSHALIHFLTALELNDIRFITFEHFMERYLHKCFIPNYTVDLSYLENIRPYSPAQYLIKRIIDITVSLLLLVITFPIMLYAIYRIKKESPGNIFFSQKRVGLKGRYFTCYKFRSMHEGSRFDPYTRNNDDRVFPSGQIMRKMRIDELPQLFNVLRGDMHLIGPRAEWHILVEEYEKKLPYYSERHLVRPGITGWAQVNYQYGQNIEDTRQKLMYDLYYIKYWNFFLEIRTIIKTVIVILKKRGT